jgi:hypothetical protein
MTGWVGSIEEATTGNTLYSLYAPPEHPEGTVHRTKDDADAAETAHHR